MARLIGKKEWIKEEGGIESVWFQELNARYFTVTCAGDQEKVKESLNLIKWKALSIGGFVPDYYVWLSYILLLVKEQYPPSEILPAVAMDKSVAVTPPSVDKSMAVTPLSQLEIMKLGERIFPILQRHFPNSEFTGKATGMILEELDNKKITNWKRAGAGESCQQVNRVSQELPLLQINEMIRYILIIKHHMFHIIFYSPVTDNVWLIKQAVPPSPVCPSWPGGPTNQGDQSPNWYRSPTG